MLILLAGLRGKYWNKGNWGCNYREQKYIPDNYSNVGTSNTVGYKWSDWEAHQVSGMESLQGVSNRLCFKLSAVLGGLLPLNGNRSTHLKQTKQGKGHGYQFWLLFWKLLPLLQDGSLWRKPAAMLWGNFVRLTLWGRTTTWQQLALGMTELSKWISLPPLLTAHPSLQRKPQPGWPLTTLMRKLDSEALP